MPTGGTPDIVNHGETGILVPTVPAMVAWIVRLLNDPDTRRQLGTNARRVATERFAADRLLPRYESLYNELCRTRV